MSPLRRESTISSSQMRPLAKSGLNKMRWKSPQPRLPWWLRGKESTCQCKRCRFDPWSGMPCSITCHGAPKPMCHRYSACALECRSHHDWVHIATTTEPTNYNTKTHMPQIPCSITREATTIRSLCTTTREKPMQQWKPSIVKNKYIKLFLKKSHHNFVTNSQHKTWRLGRGTGALL